MKLTSIKLIKELESNENKNFGVQEILNMKFGDFQNIVKKADSYSEFLKTLRKRGMTEFQVGFALALVQITLSEHTKHQAKQPTLSYIG